MKIREKDKMSRRMIRGRRGETEEGSIKRRGKGMRIR